MKDYYRFLFETYREMALRSGWSPEELLVARVFMQDIYTHRGLQRLGMSDEDIDYMLEKGALKKIKVDFSTSVSLGLKDKYADDPEYRKKALDALEKGRKSARNKPDYLKKRKKAFEKARKARFKEQRRRRNTLLKDIILPNFGIKTKSGYKKPESICVMDLVDLIEANEDYRLMTEDFYKMFNHKRFNQEIWYDIKALGIRSMTHAEITSKFSEKLKTKAMEDPEYMRYLLRIIKYATQVRMKLYEEHPKLKEQSVAASAETRRRKMQEDPEFRKQVLSNLALGNPAYRKKMEDDPKFRERQLKKHRRALAKGTRTIMRRAKQRRDALYKYIIEPEFESLDCRIGPKRLDMLLDEKYTRVRNKYYSDTPNIQNLLKKDLHKLRQEALAIQV